MTIQKKPYLIIPLLIEQSTWGGNYICEMKGWLNRPTLKGKLFGQSYELFDRSVLSSLTTSSDNPAFGEDELSTIPISYFAEKRQFPLIKFTQAKGNSFQLHVKPEVQDKRWKQKAESWYYFENGKITYGIKRGVDIAKYKETCVLINEEMKRLSKMVIEKKITLAKAKEEASIYITEKNPWQFVNVHTVNKGDIVDLSGGGLHHSWEEDVSNPLGNILYEVQQDVMDPICTIRSFDQGKFKDDGTIREIHIDDYFTHIDLDEKRNTLITQKNEKGVLFDTPYYSLSLLSINNEITMESATSFHHLFVQRGKIQVKGIKENIITVGRGHSCFIPQGVQYTINSTGTSDVLLTFLR